MKKTMNRTRLLVVSLMALLLAATGLIASGVFTTANAFDRTEIQFRTNVMTLENLQRDSLVVDNDDLRVVAEGGVADPALGSSSIALTFNNQTATTLSGTGGGAHGDGAGWFNAARRHPGNVALANLAVTYTATAGVLPRHIYVGVNYRMWQNQAEAPNRVGIAPGGEGDGGDNPDRRSSWRSLAEVIDPMNEGAAGIDLRTDGEPGVIVISTAQTWAVDGQTSLFYLDRIFFGFRADAEIVGEQTFTILNVFTTNQPASTGFLHPDPDQEPAFAGDNMYDNLDSPIFGGSLGEATGFWQRINGNNNVGEYGTVSHRPFLINMIHVGGATPVPSVYQATSVTNSNVNTRFSHARFFLRGSEGGEANFRIAGVRADGSLTPYVDWANVVLRGGQNRALTTNFVNYLVDLGATFRTAALTGFRIETFGDTDFTFYISQIGYATYDMARYIITEFDPVVTMDDLDLEGRVDIDVTVEGFGWWQNHTAGATTMDRDNSIVRVHPAANNSAVFRTASESIGGAAVENQYLVLRLRGNALGVTRINLYPAANLFFHLPNLLNAPGVSVGDNLHVTNWNYFIIDLDANRYSAMGFVRSPGRGMLGIGLEIMSSPQAGAFIEMGGMFFANALPTPPPPEAAVVANRANVTTEQAATFNITIGDDTLEAVTGHDIAAANWAFANGVLTINQAFIAGLGAGTYSFNLVFTHAGPVAVTVVVSTPPPVEDPPAGGCGAASVAAAAVIGAVMSLFAFAVIKKR